MFLLAPGPLFGYPLRLMQASMDYGIKNPVQVRLEPHREGGLCA